MPRIYTAEDLPADPDLVEPDYDVAEALLDAAEKASRDRHPDVDPFFVRE